MTLALKHEKHLLVAVAWPNADARRLDAFWLSGFKG